jgi:hypothetical protein
MQFDPAIHTKEYLLKNRKVVEQLSKKSSAFASSMVAEDVDVLKMVASHRSFRTVAHFLAQFQKVWLNSKSVKNPEILLLKDRYHEPVVHALARYQSQWVFSDEAKDIDVLAILNETGMTVAHTLAQYQSKWLQSDAAKNQSILRWKCRNSYTVAHLLAKYMPKWIKSPEAKDPKVLCIVDDYGTSVAHLLATYQPSWVNTSDAKDPELLRLTDCNGTSVAHCLALHQPSWLYSEESKSLELLKLTNKQHNTVAHYLAQKQAGWLQSSAASDPNLLCLVDVRQWSVAHGLATNNPEILNHAPIYQKEILTLVYDNKLLAEYIIEKYKDSHEVNEATMAMKLISQFAAYKNSITLGLWVGITIFEQTKNLINDCLDPSAALKYSIALYSTCFHNTNNQDFKKRTTREEWREIMKFPEEKIISLLDSEEEDRSGWKDMLCDSENMIKQILEDNPELFRSEYIPDILCEPGATIFNRLKAEFTFENINIDFVATNDNQDCLNTSNVLY